MAIITSQHCDRCQAEIPEVTERPGFPQMSWCFYKKGYQIFRDALGAPVLKEGWQGAVSRTEFCQAHGQDLNVILKAYASGEARLTSLISVLRSEDDATWARKQDRLKREYDDLLNPQDQVSP